MNAPKSSPMSRRHVLVQGVHGVGPAHLSVLLVHVVGARSRIVADPDAKVLDLQRALLVDDIEGHDLAGGLLHFLEFGEEIEISTFGNDIVRGENSEPVEFGRGIRLSRKTAPNDLIFLESC